MKSGIAIRHLRDGADAPPSLFESGILAGPRTLAPRVENPDAPDPRASARDGVHRQLWPRPAHWPTSLCFQSVRAAEQATGPRHAGGNAATGDSQPQRGNDLPDGGPLAKPQTDDKGPGFDDPQDTRSRRSRSRRKRVDVFATVDHDGPRVIVLLLAPRWRILPG